ncbi:MAG: AraC family transcriptional regulator [Verrucomicrobiota bacterium]
MKTKTIANLDFLSKQVLEARRYYLNLDPPSTTPTAVVCGGSEHCEPEYRIRRSGFRYYGLEFVARGEGALVLAGRKYRLVPGMVFAYGPKVPHEIVNDQKSPMVKYYVDFVGKPALRLLQAGPLAGWKAAQVSDPQQIFEIFELLQRNGTSISRQTGAICATLLELLLLKVTEKAAPESTGDLRTLISYQRARQYLEQHYMRLKSVEEVAQAVHLNLSYLCRLFRRYDQVPPYQHLVRLKMNRAAEMLLEPGVLVKQVSEELQFSDPYNFSRSFKSVFGMSPEKFIQRGRRD